jgi:Zn-dependent protease with chaperone function
MSARTILILLIGVALATTGLRIPAASAATPEEQEIRLGRQAAEQLEKQYKVVADPAVVDRLTRIGLTVASVTRRRSLPWSFKAVEHNQVNALALPGGFVYVTTGLLKFVRSDHELAAIIAHEAAHADLGHGLEMMRRANRAAFITLLIAIATRDPAIMQGASLISGGLLAGYTRDMEREADLAGLDYMTRTPYTPVATLTVLERLNRLEQYSPQIDAAAFADHPKTSERVEYVLAALQARRIPLIRRPAANYLALALRQGQDSGGPPFAEILVNNRQIVRLTDAARIREAYDLLDRLFDGDLEPFEVAARETSDGWGIFARGWAVLRLTPRDVPAGVANVRDFANSVTARLRAAIDEDIRRRRLEG